MFTVNLREFYLTQTEPMWALFEFILCEERQHCFSHTEKCEQREVTGFSKKKKKDFY